MEAWSQGRRKLIRDLLNQQPRASLSEKNVEQLTEPAVHSLSEIEKFALFKKLFLTQRESTFWKWIKKWKLNVLRNFWREHKLKELMHERKFKLLVFWANFCTPNV